MKIKVKEKEKEHLSLNREELHDLWDHSPYEIARVEFFSLVTWQSQIEIPL